MTLRARVTRTTGRTIHRRGYIEDGKLVPGEPFSTPAWVEIEATDEGFFLLYLDASGRGITDTWHQTLEQAKAQAYFEFEIEDAEWFPSLHAWERAVVAFCIGLDEANAATLLQQLRTVVVQRRRETGVGVFVDLTVPAEVPRVSGRAAGPLPGAAARYGDRELGFVVFLEGGGLRMLEGFTYEGAWPSGLEARRLELSPS